MSKTKSKPEAGVIAAAILKKAAQILAFSPPELRAQYARQLRQQLSPEVRHLLTEVTGVYDEVITALEQGGSTQNLIAHLRRRRNGEPEPERVPVVVIDTDTKGNK